MTSLDLNAILDSVSGLVTDIPFARAVGLFLSFIQWLRPYSTVVSLLFFTGILYCFFRIQHIEEITKHHDEHHEDERHGDTAHAVPQSESAKRWERIMSHMETDRESDWRLGILEADVLLSEMVTNMGYHGDSLGEKLKAIEASDFTTLSKAWEAHGVRNKIAHEGASFALTEREAHRVISLYEEVFNEFHFI